MSNPALTPREAMEAEKTRLLEQAAAVDRDMAELERIVAKYKLVVIAPGSKPVPRQPIQRSDFERAQLEAEAILRASGRPMWIDELFPMVVNRGVRLNGRDPTSVLSAYMKRNPNLVFLREHGWWIANIPWPSSETVPSTAPASAKPNGSGHAEANGVPTFAELKQRNKENVALAIEAVRELLKGKTEPMRLGAIYQHILSQGHTIPGDQPAMYLSQLLSKAGGLRNHGRAGWTLEGVKWTATLSPNRLRNERRRKRIEDAVAASQMAHEEK
jgi:hypothetical protein